jgi:hypothetical protein
MLPCKPHYTGCWTCSSPIHLPTLQHNTMFQRDRKHGKAVFPLGINAPPESPPDFSQVMGLVFWTSHWVQTTYPVKQGHAVTHAATYHARSCTLWGEHSRTPTNSASISRPLTTCTSSMLLVPWLHQLKSTLSFTPSLNKLVMSDIVSIPCAPTLPLSHRHHPPINSGRLQDAHPPGCQPLFVFVFSLPVSGCFVLCMASVLVALCVLQCYITGTILPAGMHFQSHPAPP